MIVGTSGIACYHRGSSPIVLVKIVVIQGTEEKAHQKGNTMSTG